MKIYVPDIEPELELTYNRTTAVCLAIERRLLQLNLVLRAQDKNGATNGKQTPHAAKVICGNA